MLWFKTHRFISYGNTHIEIYLRCKFPTNNSYDFKFNLIEDKFIKKQMKTKGILSYLYYQDGEVLIDEFSPKERLGEFLNNETKFYSMYEQVSFLYTRSCDM